MQQAIRLLGHLGVNDTTTSGHPLHITTGDDTFVTQMILVAHSAVEHIGNGFKSPMGMGWKSADIIGSVLGMHFVEHQKWVELRLHITTCNSADFHAITIGCRPGIYYSL